MQVEEQATTQTEQHSTVTPVTTAKPTRTSARIVIVGGGTAGITVAARLCRAIKQPNVTIIEPSEQHVYQPGQTLIGGGVFTREQIVRDERDYIPAAARWVKDAVVAFHPDKNEVVTAGLGTGRGDTLRLIGAGDDAMLGFSGIQLRKKLN